MLERFDDTGRGLDNGGGTPAGDDLRVFGRGGQKRESLSSRRRGAHHRPTTNQHSDFVAVTNKADSQELSTVWLGADHIAHAPAAIALVVSLLKDEREKQIDQFDLGQAMMAMSLAAADSESARVIHWSTIRTEPEPPGGFPTIPSSAISSESVTPPAAARADPQTQPPALRCSDTPWTMVNLRHGSRRPPRWSMRRDEEAKG